jgi:hypothetical protein
MALEPAVNQLESRLENRADMLRVSIHDDIGQELGERYDFENAPLLIVLDASGNPIWRGNSVPSLKLVLGEQQTRDEFRD